MRDLEFSITIGRPGLAPVALAFHAEPVAYPAHFAIVKLVKRFRASSDALKAQMYVMLASASSADGGTRKPLEPVQTAVADIWAQRGATRRGLHSSRARGTRHQVAEGLR